ncbi:MAG TPA: hypothetical protein VL221_13750 [Bacteroidota bacterium]|nr:hypothetical protein [Bacteroidota bacterium]
MSVENPWGTMPRNLVRGFSLVFLTLLIAHVVLQFSGRYVWDDAFMFIRYADNLVGERAFAFNPGGPPTYGLTSPGYLVVVVPLRLLIRGLPVLTMLISSALCGAAFLALLFFLIRRELSDDSPVRRAAAYVVVLVSLAYDLEDFSPHIVSGMDTMFALAYVTMYIGISKRLEREPLWPLSIAAGVLGGLAFIARPDLLAFTIVIPAAQIVLSKDQHARIKASCTLLISLVIVLVLMLMSARFLGSPLPLPFYAKVLDSYGQFIRSKYGPVPLNELRDYIASFPLLFAVIVAAIFVNPSGWWRRFSPADKGILLAAILFMGYYTTCVLQIMFGNERFYYPALPALCYVAARSTVFILEEVPLAAMLQRLTPRAVVRTFLAISLGFIGLRVAPPLAASVINFARSNTYFRFTVSDLYHQMFEHYWTRLDRVSTLPDDLSLASTEVGLPSAMNPRKRVFDLAGLNEPIIAHHGFSVDEFFARYQPDLIYDPHPDYPELTRAIHLDPRIAEGYEWFSASSLSAQMGVGIRKDGKYYVALREIFAGATGEKNVPTSPGLQ